MTSSQQKHFFELRADGFYRCKWCGWGTSFPEMYDTDQDWRNENRSPLRIVGSTHGCGDTVPPDEAQFGWLR